MAPYVKHLARNIEVVKTEPVVTVIFDCSCGMQGDMTTDDTIPHAQGRAQRICNSHSGAPIRIKGIL